MFLHRSSPCWSNGSQSPLHLLFHEAVERDCFCVLEARGTKSICFSVGELKCGDDSTNPGAAGSHYRARIMIKFCSQLLILRLTWLVI